MGRRPSPNAPCPCGSGAKTKRCCGRYHRGAPAPTPEALMRSRYAAYALGDAAYIQRTTHPGGPHWEPDAAAWARSILVFCRSTDFEALEVRAASEDGERGEVTFRAQLVQGGRDASFVERSRFLRVEGRWLYHSGERVA